MPCGSGSSLKGNVGTGVVGGFIAREQHVDLYLTGKLGLGPLERLLRTGGIEGLTWRSGLFRDAEAGHTPGQDEQQRPEKEILVLHVAYTS